MYVCIFRSFVLSLLASLVWLGIWFGIWFGLLLIGLDGFSREFNSRSIRSNSRSVQFKIQFTVSSIRSNSIQFGSVRFGSIQFNPIQSNSIRFDSIQFNSIQFNSIRFNSVLSGSVPNVLYVLLFLASTTARGSFVLSSYSGRLLVFVYSFIHAILVQYSKRVVIV